jgi:hypothetical protein
MRVEKTTLCACLKRPEEVTLVASTQHRSKVREQLRQRLARLARGRSRLATKPGTKRALRSREPPPQPVAARQRKRAAGLTQPRGPTRQPPERGPREAQQRERADHETPEHRHQRYRERAATTPAQVAVRAQEAPPPNFLTTPAFGVAA